MNRADDFGPKTSLGTGFRTDFRLISTRESLSPHLHLRGAPNPTGLPIAAGVKPLTIEPYAAPSSCGGGLERTAASGVVDYNIKIRIKSDGSGVELANVKMSMNPFDEIAVEEALRQKARRRKS